MKGEIIVRFEDELTGEAYLVHVSHAKGKATNDPSGWKHDVMVYKRIHEEEVEDR